MTQSLWPDEGRLIESFTLSSFFTLTVWYSDRIPPAAAAHPPVSLMVHPSLISKNPKHINLSTRGHGCSCKQTIILVDKHEYTTFHSCYYSFFDFEKILELPLSISRGWHAKMRGGVVERRCLGMRLTQQDTLTAYWVTQQTMLKAAVPPQTFQSFIVLRRQRPERYE